MAKADTEGKVVLVVQEGGVEVQIRSLTHAIFSGTYPDLATAFAAMFSELFEAWTRAEEELRELKNALQSGEDG